MGRREALARIGAIVGVPVGLGGCEEEEGDKATGDSVHRENPTDEILDVPVAETKSISEPSVEPVETQETAPAQEDGVLEPEDQSVGKAEAIEEKIEKEEIAELLKNIDYRNIDTLEENKIGSIMQRLRELVDQNKLTQAEVAEVLFPPNEYAVNFFYSDKHIKELNHEAAKLPTADTPYNEKTRTIASKTATARKWRARHVRAFGEYARYFAGDVSFGATDYLFDDPEMGRLPNRLSLRFAHQDAFDIFYSVQNDGEREIGPELHSMGAGLVVAAEGNWQGGKEKELYRGGGLSPKSGNAVLIFNPETNEFSYYAHLDSVSVKRGDVVSAGDRIGIGGNTGFKARRKGRGGHMHFEIHVFDPAKNTVSSVKIYELADRIGKIKKQALDVRRLASVDSK